MGALIVLFIGVIVVLALLPSIANSQYEMTDKFYASAELHSISSARVIDGKQVNESVNVTFTVTNYPQGWRANGGCVLTNFALGNSTANFTVTTDYLVNTTAGTFFVRNSTAIKGSDNSTYAYYNFCGEGYVKESATRSVARLILVFAALGLLGFAVWGALSESGWLKS